MSDSEREMTVLEIYKCMDRIKELADRCDRFRGGELFSIELKEHLDEMECVIQYADNMKKELFMLDDRYLKKAEEEGRIKIVYDE